MIVISLPLLFLSWFGTVSFALLWLSGSLFLTIEGWAYLIGLDVLLLVFAVIVPLRQVADARRRRRDATVPAGESPRFGGSKL
ncbi:MAG: hypothetical protein LLF90_05790 [Methanomicrobiaceae archaeon]|uniref:hypothetical protein n=1 Tax=Methanoculleus sp. TaxID=90427 RepID=UPI00320C33B4|nr:hypothetical protein [Methanomicrobiaceae archaeon]